MSSKRPHSVSSLKPPAIRVLPLDECRPFWSVMIAAYNPRADYLEQTLRSVLRQDPGSEQMQIEVIDDRSTDDVAAQTVGRVGGGRVSFHAQPQNEVWERHGIDASNEREATGSVWQIPRFLFYGFELLDRELNAMKSKANAPGES